MEVNLYGKILELTGPELFDYPIIYLVEPGSIDLSPDETAALRRYHAPWRLLDGRRLLGGTGRVEEWTCPRFLSPVFGLILVPARMRNSLSGGLCFLPQMLQVRAVEGEFIS